MTSAETRLARLHAVTRVMRHYDALLLRLFRWRYSRAPGWVVLTTCGRKTGLPREVVLPCNRTADAVIVTSTYGEHAHWLRNLRRDPRVQITVRGRTVPAHAEVIDDPSRRQALAAAHPMFVLGPFRLPDVVARTVLRPILVPLGRRWVAHRPVVVIRPDPPLWSAA